MASYKSTFLLGAILLVFASTSFAQLENVGTFNGTVFGDYYWIADHHLDGPQPQRDIVGANGFRFRRIYFTHEYQLGPQFSTRLRLEMENAGDYNTEASMTPGVKDAYLKWKPGRHTFYLGISGSPTWGLVEDVWGYRSIEQSPLDLQGFGSSRDFGLSAKGPLNKEGTFQYHAMIGNGAGTSSEINQGKKFMLSISYNPSNPWILQIYGDHNKRPGTAKWSTGQLFIGYRTKSSTIGGLLAHQIRDDRFIDNDQTIASVFAHFSLHDQLRGVLRVDHTFNNNPAGNSIDYLPFSNAADATLLLAGLDLQPVKDVNVHLMPNLETVFYNDYEPNLTNRNPDTDLVARLTFSYGF